MLNNNHDDVSTGLAGAVLAGGHSRRMGRDKATLVLGGEPLWSRQVRVLRAAGAHPVGLVRRADQPALGLTADVALWLDTVAGAGPLAGLHAALAANGTPWLAVLAVDAPGVSVDWFRRLGAHCRPGAGAIGRAPDGHFEPLAAIYPAAALAEVVLRLGGTDRSLQALARGLIAAETMTAVAMSADDCARLASWNAAADVTSAPRA